MKIDIDYFIRTIRQEVRNYKVPVVDLIAAQTNDPYKILVATILSARTKDETTAKAASRLFSEAPDLESLKALSEKKIEKIIYPVGFFRAKAGYLAKLPGALEQFGSKVPQELDSLLKLPGVGRKTANLVLAAAFKKKAICVDTHVHRIMNIWGYVKAKTPLETEMALRDKLPPEYWLEINSILVAFGQGTCRPVSPHCDKCPLKEECPRLGVKPRRPLEKSRAQPISGQKTFMSWNVNGIRAVEKKGFIDLVKKLGPDILAVQETKAHKDQLSDDLKNISPYNSYWHSAVRKGYSGVAVYSKMEPENIIYGLRDQRFDTEGRVLTLEFADFYFVNAYFPNSQHKLGRIDYKFDFNTSMHKFLDGLAKKKTVVVCGDFNVAHKPIDLTNPEANQNNPGYTPQERAWMDRFTAAGYIDTFRKFHKEPERYTWWSYRFNARERNIGWRIDYFFVDQNGESRVLDAGILSEIMGSDHCPIILEFK